MEGCSLSTQVVFEYRFAELVVRPLWLEQRDEIKRDNCIHELVHLHVNPMFDYANNTIGVLLSDDEKGKVLSQEALRRFCEGATQDLTDTIFKRLG
jgi:hypothetical protein